jgi:hypothetical protein
VCGFDIVRKMDRAFEAFIGALGLLWIPLLILSTPFTTRQVSNWDPERSM